MGPRLWRDAPNSQPRVSAGTTAWRDSASAVVS